MKYCREDIIMEGILVHLSVVLLFTFWDTVLRMYSLNSLSYCINLTTAGIKGMSYHIPLKNLYPSEWELQQRKGIPYTYKKTLSTIIGIIPHY